MVFRKEVAYVSKQLSYCCPWELMNDSLFICRLGEGAVQEGMGHVPDEDGGGREGILQDDGHHPSKLHACLAASFLCFPSPPPDLCDGG